MNGFPKGLTILAIAAVALLFFLILYFQRGDVLRDLRTDTRELQAFREKTLHYAAGKEHELVNMKRRLNDLEHRMTNLKAGGEDRERTALTVVILFLILIIAAMWVLGLFD